MDTGADEAEFNPLKKQKREPRIANYSAAAVAERMKTGMNPGATKFSRNAISSRTLPHNPMNPTVKSASQDQIVFSNSEESVFPTAAWSTAEKERKNLVMKRDARKIVQKERRTSKPRPSIGYINAKAEDLLRKKSDKSSSETGSHQVDIHHYVSELKKMFGTVCKDAEERYGLLKERDDLMCKARVHSLGTVIKGTMREMCSEKERYLRLMSKASQNCYERTPDEFVKDYARSAADQELPLPHELRPIETLVLTTDYLMTEIVNQMPDSGLDLIKWYEFIWSRTRAIRKELTQQRLVSLEVVDIIEKCIRFHIFARYKLAPLETAVSNPKMNLENLSKCLQSLRHCYEDLMKKAIYCPNEAEFRAYDILLNIEDSGVVSQVKHYREEVKQHPLVQNALSIACAFHCDDFRYIFKLVAAESTTYLQACVCHCSFAAVREKILLNVAPATQSIVELQPLVSMLHFDNESECLEFLKNHNCEEKMTIGNRIMLEIRHARPTSVFGFTDKHSRMVDDKKTTSISEVICGKLLKKVLPPKVYSSFDENDRYVNDPVALKFIKESTGENFSLAAEPTNKNFFVKKDVPNLNPFPPNNFLEAFANKPGAVLSSTLLPPSTTIAPKASFTLEKPVFGQSQNAIFGQKQPLTSSINFKNITESTNEADKKKKEAEEAEKQRIAAEMEEKRRQAEELEKQKRLAEEMERKQREERIKREKELQVIKGNVTEKIIQKIIGKSVRNIVVAAAEKEATKFKKIIKERQKIMKRLAESLVADVLFKTLLPIVDEVHGKIQHKWDRLAQIGQNLQRNRLQVRISRYLSHWKLYTRWKKERYAIETFKDALKNANDDALKNFILPSSFMPRESLRTEIDNLRSTIMTIRRWKAERLAKKYFALWRKNTPIKKAHRLWREDFVRLPPPKTELMMRDHLYMKQTRRTLPLFRKRVIAEEPTTLDLAVEAKRFHHNNSDVIVPQFSTPISGKIPRFPSITLSPVTRRMV